MVNTDKSDTHNQQEYWQQQDRVNGVDSHKYCRANNWVFVDISEDGLNCTDNGRVVQQNPNEHP